MVPKTHPRFFRGETGEGRRGIPAGPGDRGVVAGAASRVSAPRRPSRARRRSFIFIFILPSSPSSFAPFASSPLPPSSPRTSHRASSVLVLVRRRSEQANLPAPPPETSRLDPVARSASRQPGVRVVQQRVLLLRRPLPRRLRRRLRVRSPAARGSDVPAERVPRGPRGEGPAGPRRAIPPRRPRARAPSPRGGP